MIIIICISIIAGIFLLFLLGPRLNMKVKINSVDLPLDINSYVINNEKDVKNLVAGAEKLIVWANKINEQTEYSVVYFHGFTVSRQEISPVTETIGQKLGANIFFTRLKGHGLDDIDALGEPILNDWLNDAWEAYEIAKKIGNKVIFISVSAGSILSLWLTTLPQSDIAANVIISPMFEPANSIGNLITLPWGNLLARLAFGEYVEVPSPAIIDTRKLITLKYSYKALLTAMSVCKFSWSLKLNQVKVPTLCFYTDNDKVVSISRLKSELNKIDDKYIKLLKVNARHHCLVGNATCPEMNDEVIQGIVDFLSEKLNITE